MGGIFVSHTHSDQALADAIAVLIDVLFDHRVPVNYSSKKELDGGIAPARTGSGGSLTKCVRPTRPSSYSHRHRYRDRG
jgi:hypothetical protein